MTRIDCQITCIRHKQHLRLVRVNNMYHSMIKLSDKWLPPPTVDTKRRLVNKHMYPQIEMKMVKDGIYAEVTFPFFDPVKDMQPYGFIDANYKRIIKGTSKEVYTRAARVASKIGLSDERNFNTEWNRTLLNLLNKPSKDKTMINLGVYKPKNDSGLYDVKTPAELLSQKLIASKLPGATLAARAGVDEATLFRHLAGTFHISREVAIKYSNVLGCDPSELLFNPLQIPVWGSTDLQEMAGSKNYSVYPGEIIGSSKEEYTLCPREIYRPDVKAIRINSEDSFYHNHVAFYYNSNEPIVFENQLVVVGVRLKNFKDDQVRFRYFFGIYKKNKNNKTVDILNPDPEALDVASIEQDEYCNTFDDLKSIIEGNRYVIDDIEPEFVAPIVALVNHNEIKEKENYIKDHNKFYYEARTTDLFSKNESKKFNIRNFIINKEIEKIKDDINDGSYKHQLSDFEINRKAEEKADQIFLRIKDLYYTDVLKNINKRLRPDISIKTDKGIKNFEIKTKDGIRAVRDDLSQEEIDRINQIDDHLNDLAEYESDVHEDKSA